MGENLSIGPGEIRGGAHCSEIRLPFWRRKRSARELPIGQRDSISSERTIHAAHEVGTYLVPEAARAGVQHYGHLALEQPKHRCRGRIQDLVDHLDLEKMISATERAELVPASFLG